MHEVRGFVSPGYEESATARGDLVKLLSVEERNKETGTPCPLQRTDEQEDNLRINGKAGKDSEANEMDEWVDCSAVCDVYHSGRLVVCVRGGSAAGRTDSECAYDLLESEAYNECEKERKSCSA